MLSLGPLTDRFGHRSVLVAGSLLVALALLLIAGAARYTTVLASAALLGIGGGALNGATNSLVADLHTEPRRKSAALSLLGVFFGFGALFLPFTIGSLLSALGLAPILYLALILSAAPAVVFLALAFPPPKQGQGLPLAETARLARHPLVLLLGFLLFFQSGNEFIVGGYTSTYLTLQLGISVSGASYLLAAYWGSIMVARVIFSRLLLRVKGSIVVLLSALCAAAGVIALLLASNATIAAVGVVLIGLGFASIYPTILGLAGSLFEGHSGTVFGILFAIALVGGMTMPWAVGQLAGARGLRMAMTVAVGNCLMIFLLELLVDRLSQKGHNTP
ncbi:MAG: MFS transporter [Acidobacteria bacterium]|nr:MFS transporter [Acidobacteriota bacterium]